MSNEEKILTAVIYSAAEPSKEQKARFGQFLKNKYGSDIPLQWEMSDAFPGGFRLEVGSDIYDWSVGGRFRQLRDTLVKVPTSNGNIIPLLKESIQAWTPEAMAEQVGEVITVGDGIATVAGLPQATFGEILLFADGVRGMVQDIRRDNIGCVLFSSDESVTQGSSVKRTGKTAGTPVGENFLGRVVDSLGSPVDGLGDITASGYMPVEAQAPPIIDRQPVDTPLETGIFSIDSMFPIGRGQRELIIGDRQTGKTAIAIDAIINQKGKNCICIYVAIGQKTSSVVQIQQTLKKHGALDYSIIVTASASDPAPLQYIAPYAGCAMGEYFMRQGKDVLIVYDDLSKHAVAYRALSLLLDRSPGREAYPGDVFYLHSRLLERAARLSDEIGGGSMTALPIVETQAGDVSAYIPTNIISITDGQIFLESDLFFSGQRPAVNVGLSVSRVGGDAQTKAMKKASGTLRIDLAQYREMEVFTQFASDLDDQTRSQLEYGQGLMRMLRQKQYKPKSQHEQVITLVMALAHTMQGIPADDVPAFIERFIEMVESDHRELCDRIDQTGKLDDDLKQEIIDISAAFRQKWQ
ncbi:MAG: F0F1 ATP synthase subunit alpha [Mogibacterium sp.]|nr:F0F1 ATP synthase subunit alpha [Mogibacterium sp.]MBR2707331.1 F0F1 ATP synthase subunit alpha [Mogibacterium sp.]